MADRRAAPAPRLSSPLMSTLERATSVGSTSSVTSTSSLEAAPFRLAPLGNVRAAFAASRARGASHSAQAAPAARTASPPADLDLRSLQFYQIPPSPGPDSGEPRGAGAGAGARAGAVRVGPVPGVAPDTERLEPSSAQPIPSAGVSPRASQPSTPSMYGASVESTSSVNTARPVSVAETALPFHQIPSTPTGAEHTSPTSRLPKQTAHDWQSRNAPGLGTRSGFPSSYFRANRSSFGRSAERSPVPDTPKGPRLGGSDPSAHAASTSGYNTSRSSAESESTRPTTASPSGPPPPLSLSTLRIPSPHQALGSDSSRSTMQANPLQNPPSLGAVDTAPVSKEPGQVYTQAEDTNSHLAQSEYWRQRLTPAEFVKWSALNAPPSPLPSAERTPLANELEQSRRDTSFFQHTPYSHVDAHGMETGGGYRTSHVSHTSSRTVSTALLATERPLPTKEILAESHETAENLSGLAYTIGQSQIPNNPRQNANVLGTSESREQDPHHDALGIQSLSLSHPNMHSSSGPSAIVHPHSTSSGPSTLPYSNLPPLLTSELSVTPAHEDPPERAEQEWLSSFGARGSSETQRKQRTEVDVDKTPTQGPVRLVARSGNSFLANQRMGLASGSQSSEAAPSTTPIPTAAIPFPSRAPQTLPPPPLKASPTPDLGLTTRTSAAPSTTPGKAHSQPAHGQAQSQAAINAQRKAPRGPDDFTFGDLLGEGSYSSVLVAWDELSGKPSTASPAAPEEATSLGDTNANRRVTAAEAIAGVPAALLTAQRARNQGKIAYAAKVLHKAHIIREKKSRYVGIEKEALWRCVRLKGVVTLYWTFQDRESLYFVLELAPNGDLKDHVRKLGSVSLDLTRYWTAQIAETLAAIHQVGVVHRDMKPENILLDAQWRIRITDFGSAKCSARDANGRPLSAVMSSLGRASPSAEKPAIEETSKHSFVGTAEFVSPELLDSKQTTALSDWWAFGAIIFTLLAGTPPFRGPSEYTTFQKILHDPIPFPLGFPPSAQSLVEAFLHRDPFQRLSEARWSTLIHHPFFLNDEEAKDLSFSSTDAARFSADTNVSIPVPGNPTQGEDDLPEVWKDLWTKAAPPLQAGLVIRPETPEDEKNGDVFAMFDTESEAVPTEDERQSASVYSCSIASPSMPPPGGSRRISAATGSSDHLPVLSSPPQRRASAFSVPPVPEDDTQVDDADNEDDGSSLAPSGYESSLHRGTGTGAELSGNSSTKNDGRVGSVQRHNGRHPLQPLTTIASSASSPPDSIQDEARGSANDRPLPFKVREKIKSSKLRHKAKRQLSKALLAAQGEHAPSGHSYNEVSGALRSGGYTPAWSRTPDTFPGPIGPAAPRQSSSVEGRRSNSQSNYRNQYGSGKEPDQLGAPTAACQTQSRLPFASHHRAPSAASHTSYTTPSPAQAARVLAIQGHGVKPPSPSRLFFRRPSMRRSTDTRTNTPPTPPVEIPGELSSHFHAAVGSEPAAVPHPEPVNLDTVESGNTSDTVWRLRKGENMMLAAPVLQRKSGAAYLFSPKRRDLVLTDWGRLVCIRPPLGQGALKVEFILAPWAMPGSELFSHAPMGLGLSETSKAEQIQADYTPAVGDSIFSSAPEPEMVISVEGRGSKAFVLTTASKRQFYYEDSSGDNTYWLRAIRRAMDSAPPTSTKMEQSGSGTASTHVGESDSPSQDAVETGGLAISASQSSSSHPDSYAVADISSAMTTADNTTTNSER